jgi:hypothetical protein
MVTQHDPLCPAEDYGIPYLCLCELLQNTRADERAALLADLITQVEALRAIYASHGAHLALRDALSLLAEASE